MSHYWQLLGDSLSTLLRIQGTFTSEKRNIFRIFFFKGAMCLVSLSFCQGLQDHYNVQFCFVFLGYSSVFETPSTFT